MPEGDTIWRVAARLAPALVGAELVRFAAPRLTGPRPRPGTRIESVDAVGKHLLVRFADGVLLQTHLRMTGSWHLYRPGERWQRPAHTARVEIETAEWLAVCFAAPVVRTSRVRVTAPAAPALAAPGPPPAPGPTPAAPGPTPATAAPAAPGPTPPAPPAVVRPAALAHLGPDLTAPHVELEAVLARLERAAGVDPQRPLVDVLLDQRIAAGIGNVYKSELLWLHRLAPGLPLAALTVPERHAVYADAHRLLRANLVTAARVTVPGVPGGLAVYRRRGRACPRCAAPIVSAPLGTPPRSTYWCPRCQVNTVDAASTPSH